MTRIIDKISKRRFVKPIMKFLAIAGVVGPSLWAGNEILNNHDENLPTIIADEILFYQNKEMRDITFNYLKDNPEIIDQLPNTYKYLQQLKWVVLDREEENKKDYNQIEKDAKKAMYDHYSHRTQTTEKRENKIEFTQQDTYNQLDFTPKTQPIEEKPKFWDKIQLKTENRLTIGSIEYFLNFEIKSYSSEMKYIPELSMIYDSTFHKLYPVDHNLQTIQSPIEEVTYLITLSDGVYFIQGLDIFKKEEGKPIESIGWAQDMNEDFHLKKIYGTEHGMTFANEAHLIWSKKESDPELRIKLEDLLNKITETDLYLDDDSRVVYKDGWLYVGSEDHLKATNGKEVLNLETPWFTDYYDFMIADIDGDGINDILLYEDPDSEDHISVRDHKGNVKYNIKSVLESYKFQFPYGEENPDLRIFNPTKLKEDIKKKLQE